MPYVIKYETKTLHIKHRDLKNEIYTQGVFYYGTFKLSGKYLFTRDQAQEIVDVNGWSMSARVKTEFIPREVKVMKGQKRIINV